VAAGMGVEAYLVDSAEELQAAWLEGKRRVGVSAGASAPENLVGQVVERLRELGRGQVIELAGVDEDVSFPLPRGLGAGPR